MPPRTEQNDMKWCFCQCLKLVNAVEFENNFTSDKPAFNNEDDSDLF